MKYVCPVILMVLVLFTGQIARAADYEVQNPYAFATTALQKNGAGFFTLENTSAQDDKLLAVEGDIAEKIELHTHIMDGDKMVMRKVEEGYEVKADEPLVLEPMGHHIMLMGLKNPLELGAHFPLTLIFETHEPMTIDVQIVAPGDAPQQSHEHHHDAHH